jgi:hypothetical protein
LNDPIGWSKNVTTPVVLISKDDGNKIKHYLEDYHDPEFELGVDFRFTETETVNYEIYFVNAFEKVYPLLGDMKEVHAAFGDRLKFEPKYVFHKNLQSPLKSECIAGGKYCLYDNKWFYKTTGRDIIIHNAKEKCIWHLLKNDTMFVEYIVAYKDCIVDNQIAAKDCQINALKEINATLTEEDVNNCYSSNTQVLSKT